MTTFSPQTFLTNQGWEGPGSGLRKGSIKKPVTVAHKTNLKGIGKERDTGYAWWDDVFSMVANKKKGSDVAIRKTSTGIHSPLPPGSLSAVSSAPDSGSTTPIASTSTSHFHTDIIGQAKLEATRREFYAKFLRGRPLEGSVQEAEETLSIEAAILSEDTDARQDKLEAKAQKRKEKELRKLEKEERRRLKKEKKDKKEKRKAEQSDIGNSQVCDTNETSALQRQPLSGQEIGEQTVKKRHKRKHYETEEKTESHVQPAVSDTKLSKAERKAQRAQRREEKALRSVEGTDTTNETMDSVVPCDQSATSATDPSVSSAVRAAKKARREERKRRKVEVEKP